MKKLQRVGDILDKNKEYSQKDMDCLNIVVEGQDNRLYLDMIRIYSKNDKYSIQAANEIFTFFQEFETLMDAKKDASNLFSPLVEGEFVDSLRLGKSDIVRYQKAIGRSAGSNKLYNSFKRLHDEKFIKSGVLLKLSTVDLYLKGMSEDNMSDMIAGLIKGSLINYTEDILKKYPHNTLTTKQEVEQVWCSEKKEWVNKKITTYYHGQYRLILVPKGWVSNDYRYKQRRFFSNFIFEQQIVKDAVNLYIQKHKLNVSYDDISNTQKKEILKEIYNYPTKDLIVAVTLDVIKSNKLIDITLSEFKHKDLSDDELNHHVLKVYI